jgi:hypothetical protein
MLGPPERRCQRTRGMADRDAKKGPPSPSLLNFCAKFQKIEIREMCDPKSKCPVTAVLSMVLLRPFEPAALIRHEEQGTLI